MAKKTTIGDCLQMIGDKVAIRRFARKTETKEGLALVEKFQEEPRLGRVIAVGPGTLRVFPDFVTGSTVSDSFPRYPMQCKVGDVVLLPPVVDHVELVEGEKDTEVCFCAEGNLVAIVKEQVE
jgi:co-chaperonin GroES (HSP10)